MSNPIITLDEFNTIQDTSSRTMLTNAYYAIYEVNAWEWLRNFNEESFIWSRDPMIKTISNSMSDLGYESHSGASFGWTMRWMQFLAKNGENEFLNQINYTRTSSNN